jgi:SAM-dependent methyltransferase
MDGYYPARYRRYTPVALAVLRLLYRWRTRSWSRLMERPGAALEVGCGDGFMLDVLRRRGWQVVGTERTDAAASYARSVLGLEVITGGLQALPPESRFDLIILFQVLEHVPDTLATLRQCAQLLKPEGILVIGVPNLNSWQARLCGAQWLHLDVPRHLWHFSPSSLSVALKTADLRVAGLSFVSVEHDPYGWVQSLLNGMGFRQNRLTRLLMKLDQPRVSDIGMGLVAGALLLPALVLALASWVMRSGALMEVRATRWE